MKQQLVVLKNADLVTKCRQLLDRRKDTRRMSKDTQLVLYKRGLSVFTAIYSTTNHESRHHRHHQMG